ncbi:MAG: TetR/AcrR family transcriptional regulator [Proteobacteria bacterium]|nr:TetR/AcrR family transcriptional regulator [Pseudomonadota bacterium]
MQSARTINRIQDEATRLFVSKGYYGTSVSEIARAAALTKGALYCHFPSKSALLFSLIKKWEREFLDAMIETVIEAPGDAWTKLQHWHRFGSRFAGENRELCLLFAIMSTELSGSDNEFERELRRINGKYVRFLQRLIEVGKAECIIDPTVDTHTLAYVIMAMFDGILLQWHRSRDFLEGPEFARVSRKVLLDGMIPRVKGDRTFHGDWKKGPDLAFSPAEVKKVR